jgi:hypothetical protein
MSAAPIVPVARSRTVHRAAAIGIVHQRPMRKLGSKMVGITTEVCRGPAPSPRPQSGTLPDVFYGEGVVVASSCVPAETHAL